MLFVGITLSRIGAPVIAPMTGAGIGLFLARGLGYALGVALVALVVAAVTRFRYPWIVLGVYAVLVFAVGVAKHDNAPATMTTTRGFAVPDSSQIATASPPSTTEPAATNWDRAAIAFETTHPDLKIGQNIKIMQSKINEIANPTLTNDAVLQEAYELAVRAPHWTTVANASDVSQANQGAGLPDGFVPDSQQALSSTKPWQQTYAPAAPAAGSQQTSTRTTASVDPQAAWDADARAFIAAHPDLQFNENLEIMNVYTRALTRDNPRGYDNATILAMAYSAAKADPRWSAHDMVISMHG